VTEDEIRTRLPCLECQHWRAVRMRALIGRVYLALERGEHPALPFASGIPMTGCCKSDEFDTGRFD
jgi:hypothetical protein